MLLTFSRRAAAEMQRRVERITAVPTIFKDTLVRDGTAPSIDPRDDVVIPYWTLCDSKSVSQGRYDQE